MSQASHPTFACVACGKKYVWKPVIAGKKAKCDCGRLLAVPAQPPVVPGAPDDELYDVIDDPSPAPAVPSGVPRPPVRAAAIAPPIIPFRKGLQPEPQVAPRQPTMLMDIALPIALFVLGIIATFVKEMGIGNPDSTKALVTVLPSAILGIIAGLVLVVAAVFAASAMGGVSFHDPVWMTILKLCAVALLPCAVGGILDNCIGGINGNIVDTFASVGLYFLLFFLLFRLAGQETVICVMLIWIIRAATLYAMFRAEGLIGGHDI